MIGYFSPSSELLLYEHAEHGRFIQSLNGEPEPLSIAHAFALGAVTDWVEFNRDTPESLIRDFYDAARLERFVGIAEAMLHGLSASLTRRGCIELEELLQAGVHSRTVVNRLLCAPLASTLTAEHIVQAAAHEATGAVVAIFSELLDLQTQLRRLTGAWLDLPLAIWQQGPLTPSAAWLSMINSATLDAHLRSVNGRSFLKSWNEQLFVLKLLPIEVQQFQLIGNHLNQSLFERAGTVEVSLAPANMNRSELDSQESSNPYGPRSRRRSSGRAALERVNINIDEILGRIRSGEDDQARRFLIELVQDQLSSGDTVHAVKTLCNVGQRCKDMLRYDFERMCIEAAIEIDSGDSRTLIQWGDHLKRSGRFDDAIASLRRAEAFSGGNSLIVAMSCRADVTAARGRFQDAIAEYRSIPNWVEIPSVRTAIADCLVAAGQFDAAYSEYERIQQEWGALIRASIGIAEVQKLKGLLADSLRRYDAILANMSLTSEPEANDRDIFVARMSRINVLKRMGQYQEALRSLLVLKENRPFDMVVLSQLAAIYGLLNQTVVGLDEIGALEPASALGDWLRYYVRGLLQIKCGESDTVRKSLIARWENRDTKQRPDDALRLASASAFLALEELGKAFAALTEHQSELDPVLQYVQLVLEYHLALKQQDSNRASEVRRQLEPIAAENPTIREIVRQLDQGRFDRAIQSEVNLLLTAI